MQNLISCISLGIILIRLTYCSYSPEALVIDFMNYITSLQLLNSYLVCKETKAVNLQMHCFLYATKNLGVLALNFAAVILGMSFVILL